MGDAASVQNWLVNAVMVVAILVALGLLAVHLLHLKAKPAAAGGVSLWHMQPQVGGGASSGSKATADADEEASTYRTTRWLAQEFASLRDKLLDGSVETMPQVGAVFVDQWDIAEAFGRAGAKSAVVIDGKPMRSGVDPAMVFHTDDGKLVRSA